MMSALSKRRLGKPRGSIGLLVGRTQLVVLVVACIIGCADCQQGLFPPIRLGRNLAPSNRVQATSVCGETEEGVGQPESYCAPGGSLLTCRQRTCDGGCLYASRISDGVDVLAEGTLGPSVMSTINNTVEYVFNQSEGSLANLALSSSSSMGFAVSLWISQSPGNTNGHLFSLTNGTTELFTLSSNSNTNTLVVQYLLMNEQHQTSQIENVFLSDHAFHHIAVAVHGAQLTVAVDGLFKFQQPLLYPVDVRAENIFIGTLNDGENPTLQGTLHSVLYYDAGLSDIELKILAGVDTGLHAYPHCACPSSHPSVYPTNELLCTDVSRNETVQRVSTNAHGAELLNDRNENTWWQSTNDVSQVNVTIDLAHLREVFLVAIHFVSILPRAAIILYSQDGKDFSARQYFAQNCAIFGMENNAPLENSTDVNCLHAFSMPLSDRYLEFRLLDTVSRPGIANIDDDPVLKNFSLATHVRLILMGWFSEQMLVGHRYFAISEVFISGRPCTCNGHASDCDESLCICQHNTMGPNCEECQPLFNNRSWAAGNSSFANECRKCQCNEHSDRCEYQNTAVCINCTHNTIGDRCERCSDYYFTTRDIDFRSPDACQPCDCDLNGVTDITLMCLNTTGQCECKSNVTGRRCNMCEDGFFNLTADNPDGCEPCVCNPQGTVPSSTGCDMYTGQCPCLPNVGALDCSQCMVGHYGFGDPTGCQPCDEQCSDSCDGPGPTNCQTCRNYKDADGVTCVEECPVTEFPNDNGDCRLCNGTCLMFSQSLYEANITENQLPGTLVVTLTVSDSRTILRPLRFTIISGNSEGYFSINATTGEVTTARELDREEASMFTLLVQVTDVGINPISAEAATTSVTITVLDLNTSPPVFVSLPYITSIPENSPSGVLVFTVSSTDADEGTNALVAYTIKGGNEGNHFAMHQLSGQISTINFPIDFEINTNFSLVVCATDGGITPLTSTAVVFIEVIDLNDNRPIFVQTFHQTDIVESSPEGTTVAQLLATDEDTAEENTLIQYELVDDLNAFVVDNFTGLIRTSSLLDYETIQEYNLTVIATDGVTNTEPMGTATVIVTILDVNDNRPQFSMSSITATVEESIPVGGVVLNITATDADSNNNSVLYYSIANTTALPFTINMVGMLTTEELLDRESVQVYNFMVLAIDRGEPAMTGSTSVTITVSDVNDNEPVYMNNKTAVSLAENLNVGSIVTVLVAATIVHFI